MLTSPPLPVSQVIDKAVQFNFENFLSGASLARLTYQCCRRRLSGGDTQRIYRVVGGSDHPHIHLLHTARGKGRRRQFSLHCVQILSAVSGPNSVPVRQRRVVRAARPVIQRIAQRFW